MPAPNLIGKSAFAAACAGLVLGPVHALSRYATVAGAEDLELPGVRAWAEPAARLLDPLLSWAEPQTVYVTYGKLWLFVFGAMIACALLVWRGRHDAGIVRGVEKVGWWLALPAYALLTVGLVGVYWTPFLEETFNLIAVPAMLLSIVGSLVLGIGLLRRRMRPLAAGILLVAFGPLLLVIPDLVALGSAMLSRGRVTRTASDPRPALGDGVPAAVVPPRSR